MKDLNLVSQQEQEDFLNSFDQILCDVDGVLWVFHNHIPGAQDAIKCLKKLKKKIAYVSNNCTKSPENYYNGLKSSGYELEMDDLITPIMAIVSYLKKINFSKEIYLMGMEAVRTELEKAGFKVTESPPDLTEESVPKFLNLCQEVNENVGAVVADIDVNMNYLKLQRAVKYLERPEVIFIAGGGDTRLTFGPGLVIIGPGHFHNILTDMTGRKPHRLAKPSVQLNEFIKEKLTIEDPSRVLFIGDSIEDDMGFAANCGYKKLLVLSGLAKKDELINWRFPEQYKPDYYLDSLKTLYNIIISRNVL